MLASDYNVRGRVCKVFMSLIRSANPTQCNFLVESQEVVKHLANALVHFKSYDSTLRDVREHHSMSNLHGADSSVNRPTDLLVLNSNLISYMISLVH